MAGGTDPYRHVVGAAAESGRRSTKSALARSSRATTKNEINVTPLVDVVLVLLIIFMVVTPMLQRGVHDRAARDEEPREEAGHRRAARGDRFAATARCSSRPTRSQSDQLVDRVKHELKTSRPGARARRQDRCKYGDVRKVLEKIHDAGAQNVGMGTEEQK